ncbi:serpin family protein [Patescibacteria group bacterium]|nr:serpin family protein [Patescibacteria group bacterium]
MLNKESKQTKGIAVGLMVVGILVLMIMAILVSNVVSENLKIPWLSLFTPDEDLSTIKDEVEEVKRIPFKGDKIEPKLINTENDFGFKLFKSLLNKNNKQNVVISPTSIKLAFSMALNGAEGNTKNEMVEVLEYAGLSIDEINNNNSNLMNLLQATDKDIELHIANSIWTKRGYNFKHDFLNTNQTYYSAEVTSLDFASPEAISQINGWVSKNTKGKIPTIINNIPQEMIMYLINAVYFKGPWTIEFDENLTEKDIFYAQNEDVNVYMMRLKDDFKYNSSEEYQVIELPYGKNETFSMQILLPREDTDIYEFIEDLDGKKLEIIFSDMTEMEGTIEMPKYTTEYETSLNQVLMSLGMKDAFNTGTADFSKMIDAGPENVYISQTKHKTYLEVNEKGTEAAAVTSIGVGITSVNPVEKSFYMKVDRPFLVTIKENKTNTILFLGLITDPTLQVD